MVRAGPRAGRAGTLCRRDRRVSPEPPARAALEIDPGYVPAWNNLGWSFYLLKGDAGVARALQELDATDPQLAVAWRRLAVGYAVTRDPRAADEAVGVLRGIDEARRRRLFDILLADG